MILGVNDVSQIDNEELKNSIQTIRAMVKTEINANTGTLRERRSTSHIRKADVVCIYGMSIGATDKYWWETVVSRLKTSNCRLIIFSKGKEINPRRKYRLRDLKDEIIKLLLSYSLLTDTEIDKIKSQIIVCLNSEMFKAKLEYAETNLNNNTIPRAITIMGDLTEKAQETLKIVND